VVTWAKPPALLVLFLVSCASAQSPLSGGGVRPPSTTSVIAFDQDQVDLWMVNDSAEKRRHRVETLTDSVSKLDLKAPRQARREYEKALRALYEKSFAHAVESLSKSIAICPNFVAAHNALGSAYLELGQNEQAQKEFAQAVALDDHLPYSFLNLGRAQLALRDYPGAQQSMQEASALAPLDLHLLTALTYAQFLNHDYLAAIATAHQVHGRKHETAAIVHYFAAAAWQEQNNLPEAQNELQTFLEESPKSNPNSPAADKARAMIEQIKDRQNYPAATPAEVNYSAAPSDSHAAPGALPSTVLRVLQQLEQQRQVAEVESDAESDCETCAAPNPAGPLNPNAPARSVISRAERASLGSSPWALRSTVNEVAVFFAATDHGKSVTDLTRTEVVVRDDGKPPAAVTAFRNESQLPLRLGFVIDTSTSITKQFAFEQKAAATFLQKVVTDKDDLAFVVGFSSDVLLVQDFTADQVKISHGVDQLAPAGGTALWDAVKFASDKLASRAELQPVAKILVVISDGDDNCSSATLKEAIENAEREEVIVYTVSTREFAGENLNAMVADRAMKALATRTGGASFFPYSLGSLDHRLSDLQQVIRSRYLISYKPARFETDGKYRSIAIAAQKSGHKLRVYSRRGYYAHDKAADEVYQ
jgi:Ca-activated chloride channel family protein